MGRAVIRVSTESMKEIKAVAKAKEISPGEAADSLIATAAARRAAVARYVVKPAKKAAAKRKPAAKKKPAPKPKAAKKRVRKPKAVEAPAPETQDLAAE